MSWIDIVGVAGLLATLIGIYLGWGPWREHRKKSKRDDLALLTEFARTILKDCKEGSAARFPYAEVKGAIRLTCLLNNETRPRDLVRELAKQPPSGEPPKPTLVVGEYGQGKTIACGALAQELASSFLRAPRDGSLPVLIPLREYPDLSSLDKVALTSIRRLHNFDVDPDAYKRARAAGRLVFILDGLDELLSKDHSAAVRDHLDTLLNDAAFRKNPLIVTTRPNVFSQLDVSYFKSGFNWITIQLPTLNQVYGYLSSKGLLAFLAMIQHADAELLQGLIRRPLFLDMITASAASLQKIHTAQDITESKIYDQYFNAWYLRELPKMGPTLKTLTLEQVDRILSLAANEMTTQNRTYITESEFVGIVQKEAQADPRHDLDTLERQATNRLLLVPEFSAGGRRFTFRHDSLRSYFCARYFYRQFIDNPEVFLLSAKFDTISLLFFLALARTEQAAHTVLSKINDTEVGNRTYRKDILGLLALHWAIDNKKLDSEYFRHFCANAEPSIRSLLLLNLSNRDLSNLDLSGAKLGSAMLRNSRLLGTSLANTDLRDASLDGAKLSKAILDGTVITGASFKFTDFANAHLKNIVGSEADFERAIMKAASLTDCKFDKSSFTQVDLTEATVESCTFRTSPFVSALFDNSMLSACVWHACDVNGTSFRGAKLKSCEFRDTNIGDAVGLPTDGWTDGRLQ